MSGGLSDNEKVFVEALAGAIGGFAGAVAFYPLDTIKTRIQVRFTTTSTTEPTTRTTTCVRVPRGVERQKRKDRFVKVNYVSPNYAQAAVEKEGIPRRTWMQVFSKLVRPCARLHACTTVTFRPSPIISSARDARARPLPSRHLTSPRTFCSFRFPIFAPSMTFTFLLFSH